MIAKFFIAFAFYTFCSNIVFGQVDIGSKINIVKAYNSPPSTTKQNNNFAVRVRVPNGAWQDLFEYTTYVNCGELKESFCTSSFSHFDFQGTVEVEITSNERIINDVVIRPLSKEIKSTIGIENKKVSFLLNEPSNLSVEINGDRYNNIHLFANPLEDVPPEGATRVSEMNKQLKTKREIKGTGSKKWYFPKDGETIYIGGNEVFEGSILIQDKKDITITGRGVIDHSKFDKNYNVNNIPLGYDYLRGIEIQNSENVNVTGIIINDPQQYSFRIYESNNLEINNIKGFSRVIWGDGIHMVGTSNVTINNCFLRNSDDCIAIYPARVWSWGTYGGLSENIIVTNTSLYADVVHPIQLGGHGFDVNSSKKAILSNITFDGLDILEQDNHTPEWGGVMSIISSDNAVSRDITLKNINVEDVSNGSLFTIRVDTPKKGSAAVHDGYRIENITFENITYNYSNNEYSSEISGLNTNRHINGVHFNNVMINNKLLSSIQSYPKFEIDTKTVYDITFNKEAKETTVASSQLINPLESYIFNSINQENKPNNSINITPLNTKDNAVKIALSNSAGVLTLTDKGVFETTTGTFQGYKLDVTKWIDAPNQKWLLFTEEDGSQNIVSTADTTYSLELISQVNKENINENDLVAFPFKSSASQKWRLTKNPTFTIDTTTVLLADKKAYISKPIESTKKYTVTVFNARKEVVKIKKTARKRVKINTKKLDEGVYFVEIDTGNSVLKKQIVVTH